MIGEKKASKGRSKREFITGGSSASSSASEHSILGTIDTSTVPDMNIEKERTEVMKLIISLLKKENLENSDPKNTNSSESNLYIAVSVVEVYQDEDLPQSYTYTAKIQCVVCSNFITITKCSHIRDKGAKWVVSNYRRHLQTHSYDKIVRKNLQKRKSMSILQKLQSSAKLAKIENRQVGHSIIYLKKLTRTYCTVHKK